MKLPLIEYLYTALASPGGVVLRTNNVEGLRKKLYTERDKDPSLRDGLSLTPSPLIPDELWIVRRFPDGPKENGAG